MNFAFLLRDKQQAPLTLGINGYEGKHTSHLAQRLRRRPPQGGEASIGGAKCASLFDA